MAWIPIIGPDASRGRLRKIYDEALRRAGKVFQILQIQSLRPDVLEVSTRLYTTVMHSPHSPLTRAQREMIATAVSRHNHCHY